MKFSKVFLAIILIFSMLGVQGVFAKDKVVSEAKVDNYLRLNNYPEEVINLFDLEQKQDLFNQGAIFVSSGTQSELLTEDTSNMTTDQKQNINEQINKLSQQKENMFGIQSLVNFTHVITLSRVRSNNPNIAHFLVNYNWDWNYDPINTLEDKFALSWTDDYDIYQETAKYSYVAYGKRGVDSAVGNTAGGQIAGYENTFPGAGISWKLNLVSAFTQNSQSYEVYRHKGWASIKIGKPQNNSGSTEQSSMAAKYFHKQLGLSGYVTITAPPAINISATLSYDQSNPFTKTWSWTNTPYSQ